MHLNRFERRIEALQSSIAPTIGEVQEETDISRLSADEQATYHAIVAHCGESGSLRNLSHEDLFTFRLLNELLAALEQDDTTQVVALRYRLSYSSDDIFLMFIDLAAHGESDADLRLNYSPNGDGYGNMTNRMRQRGGMMYIDDIWHWLVRAGKVQGLYSGSGCGKLSTP